LDWLLLIWLMRRQRLWKLRLIWVNVLLLWELLRQGLLYQGRAAIRLILMRSVLGRTEAGSQALWVNLKLGWVW